MPEVERISKARKTTQTAEVPLYHNNKTLLSWHAPGRPFKKRSREYFVNLLLITAAIEIVVFLFHAEMLMLVVASLAFLAIAMAMVPPHTFYYKITTEGLRVEDSFFLWEELYDFYFEKRHGMDVLKVGVRSVFPGELTIVLGSEVQMEQVRAIMIQFLPYREYVKPSLIQRFGDWLERNFPLEKGAK